MIDYVAVVTDLQARRQALDTAIAVCEALARWQAQRCVVFADAVAALIEQRVVTLPNEERRTHLDYVDAALASALGSPTADVDV